jgi:hypothetical protein
MQLSVKTDLTKRITALAIVLLSATALSACAPQAAAVPGDFPNLTLAETKSPSQLLRNDAAARLPSGMILEVLEAEDTSVACLSEEDDPDGTIRSWHSTVDVLIAEMGDIEVKSLVADLTQSFVDQDWVARDLGGNSHVTKKLLESATSLSDIQISGFVPNPDQASTALEENVDQPTVRIGVHGPCVRTAGASSDEVRALE